VIRNTDGMAIPDAELAVALSSMKGALNKVRNNVTQIAKLVSDTKNKGRPQPSSQQDLIEIRPLAGFIPDRADEADLMVIGRRAVLKLRACDELRRRAGRGV